MKRRITIIVISLSVLWIGLSAIYSTQRAKNVFDDIYYSTLDSCSFEAVMDGHFSLPLLQSLLSPFKSLEVNDMIETGLIEKPEKLSPWYAAFKGANIIDANTKSDFIEYRFLYRQNGNDKSFSNLSWWITDGNRHEKLLIIRVGIPSPVNETGNGTFFIDWEYNVENATLNLSPSQSMQDISSSIIDQSLEQVEGTLLVDFLKTRGEESIERSRLLEGVKLNKA